jgi:NAD(P)-dependent dehydrogenase (short-subunit alcohol dehydrogenase family)
MPREFKVNVFGAVAVIKVFLFFMRARRRGRILNFTSTGGFITIPGIAYYYRGSKFALEGKTLLEEDKEPFDDSMTKADASKRIEELQQTTGRGAGHGSTQSS